MLVCVCVCWELGNKAQGSWGGWFEPLPCPESFIHPYIPLPPISPGPIVGEPCGVVTSSVFVLQLSQMFPAAGCEPCYPIFSSIVTSPRHLAARGV